MRPVLKNPFRINRLIAAGLLLSSPAQAALVHRWAFNLPAGNATPGTTIPDSISNNPATVWSGTGAANLGVFNGTSLLLPGATTGNQAPANLSAYVDLPNGIVSTKTNFSLEIWATPVSIKNWQRLFDFGRTDLSGNAAAQGAGAAAGEILPTATTAPGATASSDDLMLAIHRGTAANTQRFAGRLNGAAEFQSDTAATLATGSESHFVVTFLDGVGTYGSSGGRMAWYQNGALVTTLDVNFHLNSIEDVNNWLGRSQYSGDSNANIRYNEVRVYDHTMSAAEISASYAAGTDPAAPVAVADAVTMHRGQKARIAVLANDSNVAAVPKVVIEQAPQYGTAVVDSLGKVLYTHTTGTPSSDTFTYRVTSAGGVSSAATVTISFSNSLRLANSALNVPASPPPTNYQLNNAFGSLSFTQPTCLASPPGNTTQLFVCEKTGALKLVPDVTATTPSSTTIMTLGVTTSSEQGLLGLAFHPNYATNGYFFVFYSIPISGTTYERVSRFTMANPASASPSLVSGSERILIQQADQADNHNGGDLHFGPDGYLYVSLGDEGGQNDQYNNSQRIDLDFFSGLLRIDVDKKQGSLEPNSHASVPTDSGVARYSVPPDNPYVGISTFNGSAVTPSAVRTEFWAVGLRNPWRFSFDTTGELWLSDVGQNVYEEVDLITRGGNYGWAWREGLHAGPKSGQTVAGVTLQDPLYEYVHTGQAGDSNFKGNSVTGGLVYRGTRFANLIGAYVFADYVSGNIWTLRRTAGAPDVQRIAGEVGIVAFGSDPSNGDILLADYDGNRILRLSSGTPAGNYPETLSATGVFADLADLSPSPGVLPYEPNLTFWSDYAQKRRWFTVPDGVSKMTWSRDGAWTFPTGGIWVKHFDLETTRGDPATRKRLETRLLVKNAGGSYGVSYRWNDAQTEATLVPDEGADFNINVIENGTPRVQRWHIPSRAECLSCHSPQAGHVLSFNTRQLNRSYAMNGFSGNQLELLSAGGYFSNVPEAPNVLPRHLRPDETSFPVEARVRSYLDVNCSYCHATGGTAPTEWDGRATVPLEETGLLFGEAANNGGNSANKLVVPGDTAHSIVYNRVAVANGFTRMPPLASSELDQVSIAMLAEWIGTSLPARQDYDSWRLDQFGSSTSPEGDPTADPDSDGFTNRQEFVAMSQPKSGSSVPKLSPVMSNGNILLQFNAPANRSVQVETSNNLIQWSPWDVPGNQGLPQPGGPISIQGPITESRSFYRLKIHEN